ncbi:DMT family transporter [Sodalis ligni]|uniref:Threonine/homoserine exporter RhtA n=1 Tax=Sodalis ligni TaxID=2697027 RepID=A0A4V6NFN5_9GAMM|nr:DMT family transporter [Sodalis ligni]TCL04638.1 drug/metabolite transporter (DMT)-like permease [Sodalis ligni]
MTRVTAIDGQAASPDRLRLRRGLVSGLMAAVIWGGFLVVSRQGIAAGLQATDLAFLRYLTAGLILAPWLACHSPQRLTGMGWRKGVCLALLAGPLFIVVGASGYHFAPLAHAAVIQLGMLTLVSIVLAALLLGERPGIPRIAGLLVIVAGLAVTAGPGLLHGSSRAWVGDMLFALAGSMWAVFTVLQRQWKIAPLQATAVVSVLSGLIYTPIYLFTGGVRIFSEISPAMFLEQIVAQGVLSGVIALFCVFPRRSGLGGQPRRAFSRIVAGCRDAAGHSLDWRIPHKFANRRAGHSHGRCCSIGTPPLIQDILRFEGYGNIIL